jgi:hypothetical protein
MEEVDRRYTGISLETAVRVYSQLEPKLTAAGFIPTHRLQGSVPLNVHIRGVSDVDILVLRQNELSVDWGGSRAARGEYRRTNSSSIDELSKLGAVIQTTLTDSFPAAKVDPGDKAISISGGSLPRKVDVVPSQWWDNARYQDSGEEHERGVTILDKSIPNIVNNLPFLHIKLITDRCDQTAGSLRKSIRLCKNVKSDADGDIKLSSYDIAAIMYHADLGKLRYGAVYELAILAETQRLLEHLVANPSYARSLDTPDKTRKILNSNEKLDALAALSREMTDLANSVAREQDPLSWLTSTDEMRERLTSTVLGS